MLYDPFKIFPPNIDQLSLSLVPKDSRVLELGCGNARLGEFMEKKLGCKVIGVEIDEKKAQIAASKISQMIIGDLEDVKIQNFILKQGKFDVIFASAILEHLREPKLTLLKILRSLEGNGIVIVTLPNIAHWSMRLQLLFGKFNYSDSGILDKTHLHFYNLDTARKFLSQTNLKIIKENYELVAPQFIEKICKTLPFLDKIIRGKILKKIPKIFAYQFLFLLRKN